MATLKFAKGSKIPLAPTSNVPYLGDEER